MYNTKWAILHLYHGENKLIVLFRWKWCQLWTKPTRLVRILYSSCALTRLIREKTWHVILIPDLALTSYFCALTEETTRTNFYIVWFEPIEDRSQDLPHSRTTTLTITQPMRFHFITCYEKSKTFKLIIWSKNKYSIPAGTKRQDNHRTTYIPTNSVAVFGLPTIARRLSIEGTVIIRFNSTVKYDSAEKKIY